ncbi:MAG: hypothetical protein FWF31_11360 [Desulfobulbus sp.]|nr:hypothetical protein [Desulfobulbus sp.]
MCIDALCGEITPYSGVFQWEFGENIKLEGMFYGSGEFRGDLSTEILMQADMFGSGHFEAMLMDHSINRIKKIIIGISPISKIIINNRCN